MRGDDALQYSVGWYAGVAIMFLSHPVIVTALGVVGLPLLAFGVAMKWREKKRS